MGVLAFSTSGVLTKLCEAPAITLAFWVRVFSLGYLATVFLLQNPRNARSLLFAAGRHGLAGGVVFGFHILCYFWALKLTSVTVVFLVGAINPAVVAIVGMAFLGERIEARRVLWTAVAIAAAAGIVLAEDASGATPLFGNLVAVVATVGYCAYFLISRDARRT
ncbi:MAG: EamA family transporter, partial [Candidatus Binatia bacterium]